MQPRRTSTRLVLTAAALGVRAASTALPADALRLASSLYMLSSPPQLVALVTGGGAQLAPWLLATPGASNSILEFSVPYAKASLAAVLGHDPPQSVNAAVAESMAERAYERSVALGGGERSVGLGCTAALRSEPMRRGEHRCYIAVRSAAGGVMLARRTHHLLRERACPLARHWLSGSRRRLTPSREPPQACTASLSPLLRARGVARRAPGRAARRAAGEPHGEQRGTLDDSAHLRAPGGRRGRRAGGPRHPRARVRRQPSAASGRRSVLETGSGRPRSDTSDTAMARPRPG